jgi:diguanylate cyclase (GGDEF)-like protein
VAAVLAVVPALFAVIVLVGWGTGSESLKRLGMASVTMNPTTAVGLMMLSGALMVRRIGARRGKLVAAALLMLAGVVGVLKLFDAIAGTHLDIDTFLFPAKLALGDVRPSRIAPNAALCFVLISLALLVMPVQSARATVAAQLLALATGLISLFAVVGYLYGVGAFYIVPAFFPMAIHTAIAFLCMAGFVFLRTAQRGLLAPISDPGPAGRTSRALLPAALIIPVGFGWLRQVGEHAGLYTPEIGVALMVMVSVLSLTVLIWWNAELLLAADTRRRTAEAELARMATHDFLTGLPNRGYFMDRLMSRMAMPRRRAEDSFAIIYMDLDGFKQVNDLLGHASGDQLLRDVAARLRSCGRRTEDLVARLGGDEFAMLLDHIVSADEAESVAQRIVDDVPSSAGPKGQEVPVGMSVGIVVADVRHETPEALLNDADQALYDAKRCGKGRFAVFPGAAGSAA